MNAKSTNQPTARWVGVCCCLHSQRTNHCAEHTGIRELEEEAKHEKWFMAILACKAPTLKILVPRDKRRT